MSAKYLVGFDGSEASKRALSFAVERAAAAGRSVVIAHVLEWSPYSFLTPSELEERHARRQEEIERAETALLAPVIAEMSGKGVEIETALKYGHIANTLNELANDESVEQIFIGRNGHSGVGARLFGSVAGTLVQIAPVPCTIVP